MPIGLSKTWVDSARNTGHFRQQFWCPYCGNQQGWGESRHEKEVAALKQETERLARNLQYQEQRKREALAEAAHFRKSRDGMKGVLVKERKRVGNGICPCCNRTFGNLQRHMATKHPDHAAAIPSAGRAAAEGSAEETGEANSGAGSASAEVSDSGPSSGAVAGKNLYDKPRTIRPHGA